MPLDSKSMASNLCAPLCWPPLLELCGDAQNMYNVTFRTNNAGGYGFRGNCSGQTGLALPACWSLGTRTPCLKKRYWEQH